MKDLIVAIALTLVFSVGVGVLFVRTLFEMLDLILGPGSRDDQNGPSMKAAG